MILVHLQVYSDQPLINSSVKVNLQQLLKYIKDNGFAWFGR